MKRSTSLNTFWDVGVEIEDALERCAKAGLEALDFNLTGSITKGWNLLPS